MKAMADRISKFFNEFDEALPNAVWALIDAAIAIWMLNVAWKASAHDQWIIALATALGGAFLFIIMVTRLRDEFGNGAPHE